MIGNVFIAGTDTEVGKTRIACAILRWLNEGSRRAVGMKPVAAGAVDGPQGRVNEDALALRASGPPGLPYAVTNPWLFDDPTSPDIAARRAGTAIELGQIARAYAECCAAADIVVVEGVGGWRVPLGADLQTVDLVRELDLPVILVCGIRLGCINHALLSAEAILGDGIELLGWIANEIDPAYAHAGESVATLETRMPAPLMGVHAWHGPGTTDMMDDRLRQSLRRLWR